MLWTVTLHYLVLGTNENSFRNRFAYQNLKRMAFDAIAIRTPGGVPSFAGPVKVTFTRYWGGSVLRRGRVRKTAVREMDYDNLVAGCKPVLDAVVRHGVIEDDRLSVVGKPEYNQVREPERSGELDITIEGTQRDSRSDSGGSCLRRHVEDSGPIFIDAGSDELRRLADRSARRPRR